MGIKRGTSLAAVAVVVALAATACGGDDKAADATKPAGAVADAQAPAADPYGSDKPAQDGAATGAKSAGQLTIAATDPLGPVLTDGAGFTLYRFDKDTAKPPKSNCEGDCAAVWPVVSADDASAGAGIEAGALGSVTRADGTRQLTLGGWPVYRYAKDTKAGDTLGEGVGGTWHAVGPDGKPASASKGAGAAPQKPAEQETGQEAGQQAEQQASLSARQNAQLGTILADSQGRTLYRFDKDSAWPMKFGCLDACLNTWKQASPVDKAKVKGIATELVGSVKRPDGSEQLTIDCWPVYTFTGDKEPGDINGQNKQGLWFAVTDKGKKAKAAG